jgi:hypothetical protein
MTTTTITEEERVPFDTLRLAAAGTVARVSDRVLASGFLLAGATLVYLVLFDQGAAAEALFGTAAGYQNLLHEFFHDGRHLSSAPCH